MARLTDAKADSLIAALTGDTGVYAATSSVPADPNAWHPAEGVETPPPAQGRPETDAQRLRSFASDAAKIDELGRVLTLDLAAYLRRPVRCSLGRAAPAIPSAWRFVAEVDGGDLWIEIDIALGSALADAMIGGDGSALIGRGRKVRSVAAVAVKRMIDTIARAASIALGDTLEAVSPADEHGPALASGLCAVAVDEFPWAIGVVVDVPKVEEAKPVPVELQLDRYKVVENPDDVLRSAIDALGGRLAELTHDRIVARLSKIERIDGADVAGPKTAILGLALTAGGNGAVVAFADAGAVCGIAGAAAGARAAPAMNGSAGEVAIAAAEALVRDALEHAVVKLPALGDDGHRVVRLSDDPLTARTPHHAVDVEVSNEGEMGTLRVLVPSWMLVHREKRGR